MFGKFCVCDHIITITHYVFCKMYLMGSTAILDTLLALSFPHLSYHPALSFPSPSDCMSLNRHADKIRISSFRDVIALRGVDFKATRLSTYGSNRLDLHGNMHPRVGIVRFWGVLCIIVIHIPNGAIRGRITCHGLEGTHKVFLSRPGRWSNIKARSTQ